MPKQWRTALLRVALGALLVRWLVVRAEDDQWNEPRIVMRDVAVGVHSLDELSAAFGHIVSDVEAAGKARLRNGTLVESSEWAGLKIESLASTIAGLQAVEAHAEFGALRATFFSKPNPLTDHVFPHELIDALPALVRPLNGFSLWLRRVVRGEQGNAVGWHAHPDAGLYLQLIGTKTFLYVRAEDWKRTPGWELDVNFPLAFANESHAAFAPTSPLVRAITVRPGDVLFQPSWVMHRLDYPSQRAGEFASLRFGFVPWQALWAQPWLLLLSLRGYARVGAQVAWQRAF